jgi:hypothetical protein
LSVCEKVCVEKSKSVKQTKYFKWLFLSVKVSVCVVIACRITFFGFAFGRAF